MQVPALVVVRVVPTPQPVLGVLVVLTQVLVVLAQALAGPAGLTAATLAAQAVDRRPLHPVRFW